MDYELIVLRCVMKHCTCTLMIIYLGRNCNNEALLLYYIYIYPGHEIMNIISVELLAAAAAAASHGSKAAA